MKLNYLILLMGLLLFSACGDNEDPIQEDQNIVDIALADAQFSTLVSALERTNLVSTLQGDGPFTVFAPTNTAFEDLGVDLNTISDEALTEILFYHVLGANLKSTDLQDGQTYASTAAATGPGGSNLSVLIEKNANVTLNNTATVTTADVTATNGIIHIINKVITPLDIVGHATANSNFSSLVGALGAAPGDLVSTLSSKGPFTVFGPVNTAFSDIQSTVDGLTGEQLQTVLLYHVVGNANVRSTDLTEGQSVMTVSNQEFTIDLANGQIQDQTGEKSSLVLTDVQATNGVIHVLNRVLIPNL